MFFKQNYEKLIINTLQKVTSQKGITRESNLYTQFNIDSITWLQIIVKLEKSLNLTFDPDFIANAQYETVGDLIKLIADYVANRR